MKPLIKEALRWCVIAAAGGYSVWVLSEAAWGIATRWEGWFDISFLLILLLLYVAPMLAVAWFVLRRQYRKLFLVLGVVGALILFGVLSCLPRWLGMHEYVTNATHTHPAFGLLGLPLCILLLFGPIYGAAWFYRICRNLADRGTPGWEERKKVKTRATRWLVWLGVLCMLLPPMFGMIATFHQITQTPNTPPPFDMTFDWIAEMMSIGSLLIFLGLVRRRPVSKPNDNTPPLEPILAQSSDPR